MPVPNGPQFNGEYDDLTEMVPISILKNMRGNRHRYEGAELQKLADDIKTNGLNYPGVINYFQQSRTAYLGEGNHRLTALEMAGFTHMPATVQRLNSSDTDRGKPVRGIEPNSYGHVPSELSPSQIMDIN